MRVLVIESHADTAAVLLKMLRREGFDVEHCATGADALRGCAGRLFDLLVCDIRLSDCDAWDLLPRLRACRSAASPAFASIALTSLGEPEDVEKSWGAGFDAHVTKPAALGTLLRVIERLRGRN